MDLISISWFRTAVSSFGEELFISQTANKYHPALVFDESQLFPRKKNQQREKKSETRGQYSEYETGRRFNNGRSDNKLQ